MSSPAERMMAMRKRRGAQGFRELRLVVPDPRAASVRKRVAEQVRLLDRTEEAASLAWIEAVSEFDAAG